MEKNPPFSRIVESVFDSSASAVTVIASDRASSRIGGCAGTRNHSATLFKLLAWQMPFLRQYWHRIFKISRLDLIVPQIRSLPSNKLTAASSSAR